MNKRLLLQLLVVLPLLGATQIKASGKIYNNSSKNIYIINETAKAPLTPYPGLSVGSFCTAPLNQNYVVYPSDSQNYINKNGTAAFLYYKTSQCFTHIFTTTNNVNALSNSSPLPLAGDVHIQDVSTTTQNGSTITTMPFTLSAS